MGSTGGIFQLLANDGKADGLITAQELLQNRLNAITYRNTQLMQQQKTLMAGGTSVQNPIKDTSPTLREIEETHLLFVNAHFKPYVAIGTEYNKVQPQSVPSTLTGITHMQFSIPQFGDFFHDMVVRVRLGAATANTGLSPKQSLGTVTTPAVFPHNGTYPDGSAVPGSVNVYYNLVDINGVVIMQGSTQNDTSGQPNPKPQVTYSNFVRYCEFPGNRLFRQTRFDVNGNPIDMYDQMVPTMLEKFCVPPHKRVGYNKLIGQEVPMTCYGSIKCGNIYDADSVNTPRGITVSNQQQSNQTVGLFNQSPLNIAGGGHTSDTIVGETAVRSLDAGTYDVFRYYKQVVNGPQTPKPVQPPLEIWNKLRFWFNESVELSVPSVSIPYGQRFITIDLESSSNLLYETPSLFLQTITESTTTVATSTRTVTYTPIYTQFGIPDVTIEKSEMYINNIFVLPEIHDIYIKRLGFSLIRVHRQQTSSVNSPQYELILSQLKWPTEYLMVGMQPAWNTKNAVINTDGSISGNVNQWRDWHRLTKNIDVTCDNRTVATLPSSQSTPTVGYSGGDIVKDQYYLPVPTVDTMSITSHGINIIDYFADKFFNQYVPYHYGSSTLNTPEDPGALFVTFALYPKAYQPSGHLNISRVRETYIRWTSSYISASTPANLCIVAICINFLVISDGSCMLRYST